VAGEETELILCELVDGQSKLQIAARGPALKSSDDGSLKLASVRLRYTSDLDPAGDAETVLAIVQNQAVDVDIPVKLLVSLGDGWFRIRRADELGSLVQEEWAALKDRVRRRLAAPIELEINAAERFGLFGITTVGDAKLSARFWLAPALVDGLETIQHPDDWILRAEAEAAIGFEYKNSGGQGLALKGRFLAKFTVRKRLFAEWIDADFGFDLPDLSGFDLRLPKMRLPKLKFSSADIPFEDILSSFFTLPLPPILGDLDTPLKLVWNPRPQLKVTLSEDGALKIVTTTAGTGTFKVNEGKADENTLVIVSNVALDHDGGTFKFSADLDITPNSVDVPDRRIDTAALPFLVSLEGNSLTPAFTDLDLGGQVLANANLSVAFASERIVIQSKEDPAVLLALSARVSLSYDTGSRKTRTRFDRLEIVEPYPIALIGHTAEVLGELIRLVAAIPLPSASIPDVDPKGMLAILKRIGELLASAAKWLAAQAGRAAAVLAGMAEAVVEALLQLLGRLIALGQEVFTHIAIEIRLDPKTYRLRQIVVMPAADEGMLTKTVSLSALGFDFELHSKLRPALVIDLGPESWTGLVVQPQPGSTVSLGTDLWLDKETGPQQAMGTTDKTGVSGSKRLIQLTATPSAETGKMHDVVVAAIQHGRPKFLQTYSRGESGETFDEALTFDGKTAIAIRETGMLRDAAIGWNGKTYPKEGTPVLDLTLDAEPAQDRLLSMLTKADTSAGTEDSFIGKLKQKVQVTSSTYEITSENSKVALALTLGVKIHIDKDFAPETQLGISVSLSDLSMKVTGGDKIFIEAVDDKIYHPLGLDLQVTRKTAGTGTYKQFYLDLSHGNESLGLADDAKALLAYGKVSTSGKGLQFEVPTFRVGRAGFDLEAKILPEPVQLGGVNVPFRFTSGEVAIKGSKFGGGSLSGTGQLPQALIGEANASVALQLGAGPGGGVIVKGATARLDKSGDPIRCTGTRFELTITELGFDYVLDGSYHFYFLLTGSAIFKPGSGEYTSGLLKNFKDVTIKLDKAPLAADPRVLMRSISFQMKVDPPKRMTLFDIFAFELRGFGFHPASPKFGGDPAMSISGQVSFGLGDKISPNIEFHSLGIAAPKAGSSKPRVRFDGLTVGLKTGSVDIEGTAIAVDESMPDLYRPDVLPKDVTAEGFLASGRLDIDGWASMSAAMGFLELRKKNSPERPRHSFFLYGQMNKLAEPIDTPVGRIYLREFGYGFGYRYTLAGIAQAETAKTPQQLVKVLDEVSKYQGSLDRFQAWEPTYDKSGVTLALRGMFALSAASTSSKYNAKQEAELPNPLLFDIVAAFRTDFTFLINLRAWVSVNYHDWVNAGAGAAWKSNPTMRGYLYFSVPRKEFLGRFVSDGKGHIGEHPKLPGPLVQAIKNTQFSATLYVRPGLFHAELGWPYELGFSLGKPSDTFHLKLRAGLVHRIEDFSVLNGIAFKADGAVNLEGRVGSSSLGAAAVASATFSIEARVLSYLSLTDFGESFYYGYMRIDVSIPVSIQVWLSFKIFGRRITLSASFTVHFTISIALEAVIGPELLGGRAHVAIGVRAFGRSLSVGIGFSFNNDKLALARAKVARFMALGLAAEVPDRAQDGQRIEKNPKPEPPRSELAEHGDIVVDNDIGSEPLPPEGDDDAPIDEGREIGPTDFWAMLFPTAKPQNIPGDGEWYVMQLLPRDHTSLDGNVVAAAGRDASRASFYASPKDKNLAPGFDAPGHMLDITIETPKKGALLYRLASDGTWNHHVDISKSNRTDPFNIAVDQEVASADGRTLRLGKLLQTLFLGLPENIEDENVYGGEFLEPAARLVDPALAAIDPEAKSSADQLGRAGRNRTNLSGRQKREAEIEETRSAVLSAITETALQLAGHGAPGGNWPSRLPEIDARDFGLTFLVNQTAVDMLFEGDPDLSPPKARFAVLKSDTKDVSHGPEGRVELFNHPSRMFRRAQPKFTPNHSIEPQGIKLNWDLEPAWGASQGAYNDPEFHLKHYRIRRIVRGIPGKEYRRDFLVKAGSPIVQSGDPSNPNEVRLTLMRPDFQFIDDLRKQDRSGGGPAEDIPETIRRALLNQATTDEWERDRAKYGLGKIDDIDIAYSIVPIDHAGTSDFGQPYVVSGFRLVEMLPVSPREATLQIEYAAMPTNVRAAGEFIDDAGSPAIRLLVKPAVLTLDGGGEKVLWPDDSIYLLRIWRQKTEPSGSYGSDALDEARRRPDQDAIERLRSDEITDFVIQPERTATYDENAPLVAERWNAAGAKPDLRSYRFTVHTPSAPDEKTGLSALGNSIDISRLAAAIGTANQPLQPGNGYRLFLSELSLHKKAPRTFADLRRRGEWKTLSLNIAIAKTPPHDDPADKIAISSVVEVLEQPVHLEFAPLRRQDMRVESGRVIVVQPNIGATLRSLTDSEQAVGAFTSVRDGARRTATRLEWNARPLSLQLAGSDSDVDTKRLHKWIGGFDIFSIDPDTLPGREKPVVEVVAAAQPMGRVTLLPDAMRGLDPAGFGDFGRIESAYPSDTLRLLYASKVGQTSGVRKAGWYSAAETTAIFPEPSIRRSLMPDPDEGLISALFSGGRPDVIRISIPAWNEPDSDPLAGWEICERQAGSQAWGEFELDLLRVPSNDAARIWEATFTNLTAVDDIQNPFGVAELRQLLQNLRLVPKDRGAKETERTVLAQRLREPGYLAAVAVRIEAIRYKDKPDLQPANWREPRVVAAQEHAFDLMPDLHPVLGDALAFIQYDGQRESLEKAEGRVYRRFALAPDANPEVTAAEFAAYADDALAERDPYGWGALRTLGLAAGFRLYDTETGDYVRHKSAQPDQTLAKRIEYAFLRALERYDNSDRGAGQPVVRDNGQPFVDFLTQPWGNVELAWFDGGLSDPSSPDGVGRLQDEMLAVVQIGLRPHPDRLRPRSDKAAGQETVVRYFALATGAELPVSDTLWKISLAATASRVARFDVLSTGRTIVAHKPVRLSPEAPTVEFCEPRPAIEGRIIAVVRAVMLVQTPSGWLPNDAALPGLLVSPPPEVGEYRWSEIAQPNVLQGLTDPTGIDAEHAFGKFESLTAQDWSDALFRPGVADGPLDPCEAVSRVAHYAGKRFAPLELRVGEGSSRAEMADRIVRFWNRFVEHCAPAWGRPLGWPEGPAKDVDEIFFSLGTIADPGQWRRAPGAAGTISVTLVDVERRGARRKFAVRPFGRYETWSKAAPDKMRKVGAKHEIFKCDVPTGLNDAFAGLSGDEEKNVDVGASHFIDTTLPRTEPLERPVILSSVTHPAEGDRPGRFELVVAHSSDMVQAQANRRNAALLAPLDISVGFWREFPHMPWAEALARLGGLELDPMAPFGSLDQRLGAEKLSLTRASAEMRLANLRQRVPDAWLGSTMISATLLPYFFRIHALVHATAGIVVSEQTSTTFEEGHYGLAWPHAFNGYKDEKLRTRAKRPHGYSVTRQGADEETTIVTFDLAAVRFIDCMMKPEAELWFGEQGQHWNPPLRRVGHLPEPGVSYRISVETPLSVSSTDRDGLPKEHEEVLARVQEIDILPHPPSSAESEGPLYLLQQTGSRLALLPGASVEVFTTNPMRERDAGLDSEYAWRIPVSVRLAREPAALIRRVESEHVEPLRAVLTALRKPQPGLPEPRPEAAAVDGLLEARIKWTAAPAAAAWQAASDAVAAIRDSPEAAEMLAAAAAITVPTGELRINLSQKARNDPAVEQALAVLVSGVGSINYGDISLLVLRRPPWDAELGVFEKHGTEALTEWVLALAEEQLFGRGRRPAVTAAKGSGIPLTERIVRLVGTPS
jgi:hypothetical protein